MKRVTVIGTGAMGRHHVRVCQELAGVELIGIADTDEGVARDVASRYDLPSFTDYQELLDKLQPDAVIIAVPTSFHHEVATDALNAGCHVLLEKPIAMTLDDAVALLDLATVRNRVLAIGHVERFNPAVTELKRRLDAHQLGRLFQMHARRLGPSPGRACGGGVAIDLATHDLDVMRYLTGSEVQRVFAETRREAHAGEDDLLHGMLRFEDGTLGVLETSWLSQTKLRELCVTGERGVFKVDYLRQELTFFEGGSGTCLAVRKMEPLLAEQEAFIAAISGRQADIVTARDGIAALKLALTLLQSADAHQVLS